MSQELPPLQYRDKVWIYSTVDGVTKKRRGDVSSRKPADDGTYEVNIHEEMAVLSDDGSGTPEVHHIVVGGARGVKLVGDACTTEGTCWRRGGRFVVPTSGAEAGRRKWEGE